MATESNRRMAMVVLLAAAMLTPCPLHATEPAAQDLERQPPSAHDRSAPDVERQRTQHDTSAPDLEPRPSPDQERSAHDIERQPSSSQDRSAPDVEPPAQKP